MLVRTSRQELLSIATQVAKAVPDKHADKELCGIHMEADAGRGLVTLTATSHEVAIRSSVQATVKKSGSAVIDDGFLLGILAKMPEDVVDFAYMDNDRMRVRSGKTVFDLSALSGEMYPMPELPYPEDAVAVTGIPSLSKRAVFAAASDSANPAINCVKLTLGNDGLKADACNGMCLAEAQGDKDCKGQTSFLLPVSSLAMLASISRDSDVYEMGLTGSGVVFWDGTLLFSARLMNSGYPDTERMFSAVAHQFVAQVQAEELAEAIGSVSVVEDKDARLEMRWQAHGLVLRCVSQYGESQKAIPAILASVPETPFYYNGEKLRECLRTLKGAVTLSCSQDGHMVIEAKEFKYLQTALRPSKPTAAPAPKKEPAPKKAKAPRKKAA